MQNININFDMKIRKMKPLHGINNGPLSRGGSTDTSVFYGKLQPPYARLHDTHYPESREVDIHTIFPDFEKDPSDPASYDFRHTDIYLKSILDLGTKIIYRLGETIASKDKRDYVKPPSDFKKYAKVCIGIIKHYNDGWADGFHYDIRHWEIWNEPSVDNMWTGTIEQWLGLYKEISLAIREYDESLLIGGPAACDPDSPVNLPFLKYVTENQLPLDFYTFHCYNNGSEQAEYFLESMNAKLSKFGMQDIPAYITEWNYSPKGKDGSIFWDYMPKANLVEKANMFNKINNSEGSSLVAMFLCIMQDSFVSQSNYYQASADGKYSCFTKYGMPLKSYYSLMAFKKLYELGEQVFSEVSGNHDDIRAIASADATKGRILISNFNHDENEYMLNMTGKFNRLSDVKVINSMMTYGSLKITQPKGKHHRFKIPKNTVVLIEVE